MKSNNQQTNGDIINDYFRPRFIALFDVVGYKDIFLSGNERIKFAYNAESKDREVFVIPNELAPFLFSIELENLIDAAKETTKFHENIDQKVFSDNFLFCSEHNWFGLLHLITRMQDLFVGSGIFIRGALWHGNLHFSNDFISGEGIVRAAELEKKAANPCIIIDDSFIRNAEQAEGASVDKYIKHFCTEDADGRLFIDYLKNNSVIVGASDKEFYFEHYGGIVDYKSDQMKKYYEEKLYKHRDYITWYLEQLKKKRKRTKRKEYKKRLQKWRWCIDYHNRCCKCFGLEKYCIAP